MKGKTYATQYWLYRTRRNGKTHGREHRQSRFDLTVCDLREEPCKQLASLGARVAASAREVAEKSDIIEIAVVDDAQAERVVTGEHGVIHGARPELLIEINATAIIAK